MFNPDRDIDSQNRIVLRVTKKEAALITALMEVATHINPDNPMAVAENIEGLVKAATWVREDKSTIRSSSIGAINQALSAIERK